MPRHPWIKLLSLLTFCFLIQMKSSGQSLDLRLLGVLEDSMKKPCKEIVYGKSALARFNADSLFTRMLVRALKQKNSFQYPFDSLINISRLYAPDSSFRIFTWQMEVSDNLTRQHGAIQMKTTDGSLKLFPLIDKSEVIIQLADTTTDHRNWIGAVYYKIVQTTSGNQPIYTLLGFDQYGLKSDRKIIEVLTFNNGLPVFGGSKFLFDKDSVNKKSVSRQIMEFKKEAGARLSYDEDLKIIIAEHLQSETNEPQKKWTYIPDGDYEGFLWKNGKWVHIEKVFNQITPEGKEPVPQPFLESKTGY